MKPFNHKWKMIWLVGLHALAL